MTQSPPDQAPPKKDPGAAFLRSGVWRIALIYAVFAAVWIILSDRALEALMPNHSQHALWSIFKGLAFVAVTTGLLLWLLARYARSTAEAYEALRVREREVARLYRMYSALSHVNHAIVWSTDRDELFKQVCRALVDHGGFKLVWIGWLQEGNHELTPLALAGNPTDYLEGIHVSVRDEPLGRGPSGTAFREGRTVVNNDTLGNVTLLPWHARAREHGLLASVAMPIREGGVVRGILTVYAGERGFFQDREVALLQEAALDTSFALNHLARERDRAAAEARAQGERSFSQMVLDSLPGIIYLIDETGRVLRWSRSAETVSGFSAAEIGAMKLADFFAPEDLPAIEQSMRESLERGEGTIESRVRTKDGQVLSYFFTGRRVTVEGQVCMLGVGVDITERLAVEARLRESEERLRQVTDNIDEAFWINDPVAGRVLYISPAYERIWGRSVQSLYDSATSWIEAVHPDDREAVEYAWLRQKKAGDYDEVFRIVRPDGEVRWVRDRSFPLTDESGAIHRIVGSAQDVTAQQLARKELQRSESELRELTRQLQEERARLQAAQAVAKVGSWEVNLVTHETRWSDEMFRIVGADRRQVAMDYQAVLSFVHPEDLARVDAAVQRSTETGEPGMARHRMLLADGTVRMVDARWRVECDAQGRPLRLIGTTHDVTDQARLEQQVQHMLQVEAMAQLTGGLAQDFDRLLTVIMGSAETLRKRLAGQPELVTLADLAADAASRGARLTQGLLAFAGRQNLKPQVEDLSQVVARLEPLLRPAADAQVEVVFDVQPGTWPVRVDPGQLEAALVNLGANARDAMPDGGRLTIATANVSLGSGDLPQGSALAPGDYVRLTVSDTGVGIPPEHMGRLFEPFFTTKDKGKGTGLGLPMVYGFVKQSGGHVAVRSRPDEGTTVELLLPRARAT